jgi:hypothetical protein
MARPSHPLRLHIRISEAKMLRTKIDGNCNGINIADERE